LERRVAGRFTVIWSVFRAHSSAEDEFIWPALKAKQVDIPNKCACNCDSSFDVEEARSEVGGALVGQNADQQHQRERSQSVTVHCIEQEEYEEDHADEERMFNSINEMLSKLREDLSKRRNILQKNDKQEAAADAETFTANTFSLHKTAELLLEGTGNLMHHLIAHLDKEETHCMPLVAQYLTKTEINDLVGKIMGKRSSELMSQILTLAVQNLNEQDRDEMVKYMKQAMLGTFFERWLKMAGLGESEDGAGKMLSKKKKKEDDAEDSKPSSVAVTKSPPLSCGTTTSAQSEAMAPLVSAPFETSGGNANEGAVDKYTSAPELERLIRAIGTNPNLDTKHKNLTIQGLRDSVWKSNCRLSKRKREEVRDLGYLEHRPGQVAHGSAPIIATATKHHPEAVVQTIQQTHHMSFSVSAGVGARLRRETPPSSYFKKSQDGEISLVWTSDPQSTKFHPNDDSVPLFSASELAPTYHDGGINHILGCPHYARSCKLRHPTSGRLYTCRLCCEQTREMATKDKDSPLDRYEVKEILCMRCGALQPAGNKCVNQECPSRGKPFARYSCNICNFYDDSPYKSIYHCPFCNVCRSGRGLGQDYRHCMRCNACVSLTDDHHCLPQRLQGNCPICHESMFESTEPLRGLQCGHVMHLACFTNMRAHSYTCPLCKKSAEDMSEYFALLDSAIRMQPMPPAYAATTSNIYCQDCGKMGNVTYHFVGLKCQHCQSYNTRELQRVDANIMASLWRGH
jgi:zinc finger-like protein